MSRYTVAIVSFVFLLIRVVIISLGGQHEAPDGDQLAFYSGAQKLAHSWGEWLVGGRIRIPGSIVLRVSLRSVCTVSWLDISHRATRDGLDWGSQWFLDVYSGS